MKQALLFSVESDPENAFRIIQYKLPFGCHAWYKKDADVWKSIFNKARISTPDLQATNNHYE